MGKRDPSRNDSRLDANSEGCKLDEFELIDYLSQDFNSYRNHTLVPNGDDAAIFKPQQGKGQVVCVDTLVEDIHFNRVSMSPYHIGYKALAVNLSDIAAMGGEPHSFLVSLAIPSSWTVAELKEIYRGMKALADQYQVDLLGGDTVATNDKLVVNVTAIGQVDEDVRLLRSNAKPGHLLFVTDTLGQSAAGLSILLQADKKIQNPSQDATDQSNESLYKHLVQAHQLPKPHIKQGLLLAQFAKHTSISLNDVSDGLASEAYELAVSSGVNIVIDKQDIPIDQGLRDWARNQELDAYHYALHGGEDFVLVGTIPQELEKEVQSSFEQAELPLYFIGYVEKGPGEVWIKEGDKKHRLEQRGYRHFQNEVKDDQ